MITRLHIQNFKALRDVEVHLGRMNLLIGPNDSGKTSVLEAITALCRSVDHPLREAFVGRWRETDLVWQRETGRMVALSVDMEDEGGVFNYEMALEFGLKSSSLNPSRELINPQGFPSMEVGRYGGHSGLCGAIHYEHKIPGDKDKLWTRRLYRALSGVQYYRWNPQFLALPTAPDSSRRFRMESSGFGLALCLDDILGFDRDRFAKLEQRFCSIFPQVASIKLIAESAYKMPLDAGYRVPMLSQSDGKGIHFGLTDGSVIPASQASDGTLLVLAYLTVLYLPQPPRMLLVEEPENGIHPHRLREVLSILRQIVEEQRYTQVVLTTHSPYVVDLFQPEEVSLCSRGEDGAVTIQRLSDSPKVREQIELFTLGEIWTGEGDEALAKSASNGGHAE